MIVKPSLANFVSVGLMAFAGVWIINRALTMANLPHLQTSTN